MKEQNESRAVDDKYFAEMLGRVHSAILKLYGPNGLADELAKIPETAIISSQLRTKQQSCIPVLKEAYVILQDKLDYLNKLRYGEAVREPEPKRGKAP